MFRCICVCDQIYISFDFVFLLIFFYEFYRSNPVFKSTMTPLVRKKKLRVSISFKPSLLNHLDIKFIFRFFANCIKPQQMQRSTKKHRLYQTDHHCAVQRTKLRINFLLWFFLGSPSSSSFQRISS